NPPPPVVVEAAFRYKARGAVARTWCADPQARPRPPRVARAALARLAAVVAWTRGAVPLEAIPPAAVGPHTVPARGQAVGAGRTAAPRTAGTIRAVASAPVAVRSVPTARRA